MKLLITLLFLAATQAVAAPETTVDPEKLITEAKSKFAAEFGPKMINEEKAELFFQDGAGAMDLNPASDFAAVVFTTETQPETVPAGYTLAYRLLLAGGVTEIILVKKFQDTLKYFTANSGIANLRYKIYQEELLRLQVAVKKIAPEAEINLLESVDSLLFKCFPKNIAKVVNEMTRTPFIERVELINEAYPVPFQFEPFQKLKPAGLVDTDQFRTLTKEMKQRGVRFAVPAIVPAHLR